MARRAKTPRFQEFQVLNNTLDYFNDPLKTKNVLKDGPYVLELGCGKGSFVLELATRHPNTNYVGMDIKSDRMWFGAKRAQKQNLGNLTYLRAHAKDLIDIFAPKSLTGIWLTFPDPYLKKRKAKHRLTHPGFMKIYAELLIKDGWLKFKTDNDKLFKWSLDVFEGLDDWQVMSSGQDLHADIEEDDDWAILTQYEEKFLSSGKTINYAELKLLN